MSLHAQLSPEAEARLQAPEEKLCHYIGNDSPPHHGPRDSDPALYFAAKPSH